MIHEFEPTLTGLFYYLIMTSLCCTPSHLTLETLTQNKSKGPYNMSMDIEKNNIPFLHDLVVEILLKLPVRSLIRFKSACKSWHSLILDHNFTKSHLDLTVTPTNRLLYITSSSEGHLIDVDTSILRPCSVIQLPRAYHFGLEIMGSCRGFILFVKHPHLIIWNPSTGVHKPLSYSRTASNVLHKRESYIPIHLWCGFGYDTSTDDYLIVMGWHELVGLKTHVEFFSLRTNIWKELEGIHFPYLICSIGSGSGAFLNGAIHWLATNLGGAQEIDLSTDVIIAFDLVEKNFLELSLPPQTGDFFYYLKVLGEYLGVCHVEGNKAEIWVMKEYKVQSSWTKLNVVLPYLIGRSIPLCLTKDEKLVATNRRGYLVKFNDTGKYAELQPYEHDIRMMVMFTETLLSLPGDFDEVREDM